MKQRKKMSVHTLAALRRVVPIHQWSMLRDLMHGDERDFFIDALVDIEQRWTAMPANGQSEGTPTSKMLAPIHIFAPTADWWLIERSDDPKEPIFGIADLGCREMGYIYMPDVLRHPLCEIDLHYTPKTVDEIMAG